MSRRRKIRRGRGFAGLGSSFLGSRTFKVLLVAAVVLFAGTAAAASTSNWQLPAFTTRRVVNRAAAARGLRPELQAFLDAWEQQGPFDVRIGQMTGMPPGGLRTAADAAGQAAACVAGLSNACDLASTPHGRGAAIDLWPEGIGFSPYMSYEQWTPEIVAAFNAIGEFAEAYGLTWGGRWRSAIMPNGDLPHVELKNWQQLPYPPPGYSGWVLIA